jgi:uncharacterized protein YlxW (UPF0749 family)
MRRPGRTQLVVAVLLAVVGFGAVTQVRVNETDDTYSGLRQQDLIDLLSALASARQHNEDEITRLESVRDSLQSDTDRRRAALSEAQDQVDNLNILAGLVPVTGPGIRITITEDDGTLSLASLLDTIEELRTDGAEAIQVNGKVRVVAQTSFEETDAGFNIDGQTVEAPYVIDVIGEPSTLSGAIDFPLGPRQQIEADGAHVTYDELGSLDIESVHDPSQLQFAEPE